MGVPLRVPDGKPALLPTLSGVLHHRLEQGPRRQFASQSGVAILLRYQSRFEACHGVATSSARIQVRTGTRIL